MHIDMKAYIHIRSCELSLGSQHNLRLWAQFRACFKVYCRGHSKQLCMLSVIPNDTFDKAAFDWIHAVTNEMAIAACFIAEASTKVPFLFQLPLLLHWLQVIWWSRTHPHNMKDFCSTFTFSHLSFIQSDLFFVPKNFCAKLFKCLKQWLSESKITIANEIKSIALKIQFFPFDFAC